VEKIEWHDVQGLVLSGYPQLPFGAYIPWQFLSPRGQAEAEAEVRAETEAVTEAEVAAETKTRAKAWLKSLTQRVMRADAYEEEDQAPGQPRRPTDLKMLKKGGHKQPSAINVALTASGLTKLGVSNDEPSRFSAEFWEGMAPQPKSENSTPRRTNILGDVGENSPDRWSWGGWDKPKVDGLLLLYALCPNSLQTLIEEERLHMSGVAAPLPDAAGGPLILYGRIWPDLKEHFGFKDGISQPIIDGTNEAARKSSKEARISVVKPGEILHGYLNERGARVSFSSAAQRGQSRSNRTPGPSRDLARNGTYLVFRQLEQNVEAFRSGIAKMAYRLRGNKDQKSKDWVAARMIGRTQEGDPLIPPSADSAITNKSRNDFLYYFEDRFGLRCPLGAHIRRANPRDIIGPDPDSGLRLSKMHRIIRRGRSYGDKLPPSTRGKAANGADSPRGMLFIALNADIAGQFELIQHTWINNGRFNGLYEEMDPLVHFPGEKRVMTIQRRPTSLPVDGLKQFVTVRGGAYFFLPGIQALRSLAE
jgi:Dyp-type peroxidase family